MTEPDAPPRPNGTPRRVPKPMPGHLDVPGIVESFAHRMMYTVAKDEFTATDIDIYHAVAHAVRDRLMERWFLTQGTYYRSDAKRVYYLSMEFLPGRAAHEQRRQPRRARPIRPRAREARLRARRRRGAGGRRRARQRRPRAPRRLLRRLGGDARPPVLRLRHPVRIRHLPAADRRGLAGGGARQLAPVRKPLGDPAPRLADAGEVLRPDGDVPGRGRRRPDRLGRHRERLRDGLRHADPRLPERHGELAPALVGPLHTGVRPRDVQRRGLHAGRRGQDEDGEHLEGPLPARRPARAARSCASSSSTSSSRRRWATSSGGSRSTTTGTGGSSRTRSRSS